MVDRFPLALIEQIPAGSLWRELVILFNAAIDDESVIYLQLILVNYVNKNH